MSDSDKLLTPIYPKLRPDEPLPTDDPAFLLLAGNGLWICRNHEFFRSSAPARSWPCELAHHQASLELHHPQIPQLMIERIAGFFSIVADRHQAEAGVLLVWNSKLRRIELVVPEQVATVGETWADKAYPIGLHYEVPADLGPDRSLIGDVHSHVYESAYSSYQDVADEKFRPGLHLVVGRLDHEPPDFHAEYVVDGTRFVVESSLVIEGYQQRSSDFPLAWLERVSIKRYGARNQSTTGDLDQDDWPYRASGPRGNTNSKFDDGYGTRYLNGGNK